MLCECPPTDAIEGAYERRHAECDAVSNLALSAFSLKNNIGFLMSTVVNKDLLI